MPAITYQDFSGGLDRRLPITVQEASRLWTLRNAYITLGKRIAKRPALLKQAGDLTGTKGLRAVNDRLKVFAHVGSATPVLPSIVDVVALNDPLLADGGSTLLGIHFAEMFQGYLYTVACHMKPSAGIDGPIYRRYYRHHYIDGGASTIIADAPVSRSATKAASRVFAVSDSGETVKYCAVGNARDWTTASDAGFLPTSLQQDTKDVARAVGTFADSLAVFFPESIQVWTVAVDPSANAIKRRIYGPGSSLPQSLASFSNDLVFLSPSGFRSMTVAQITDRIDDTDMGVQIDPMVQADMAAQEDSLNDRDHIETFSAWLPQFGQYWCVMDMGTYSKAWVYSYSKSSKLSCWSEYTFPVRLTGITTLGGKVYVRSDTSLYVVDRGTYTDDGEPVAVEVQMAFQDSKLPGVSKQFYGADMVVIGSADLSALYDPRDISKESITQTVSGDTRPGDMIPVELVATSIAPVFRHEANEAFELAAISLYYNQLGTI